MAEVIKVTREFIVVDGIPYSRSGQRNNYFDFGERTYKNQIYPAPAAELRIGVIVGHEDCRDTSSDSDETFTLTRAVSELQS
jgi:hypothetical protein